MKNKMKNKTKPQMPNLVMRPLADPNHFLDKAWDFSQMSCLISLRYNLLSKAMLDIYNKKVSVACKEGEGRMYGDDGDWELRKIGQYNWGMFSQAEMFIIDDKGMVDFLDSFGIFKAEKYSRVR